MFDKHERVNLRLSQGRLRRLLREQPACLPYVFQHSGGFLQVHNPNGNLVEKEFCLI